MSDKDDPYPWLDKDDPRRNMTDKKCIEKFVDLSDSDITEKEKKNCINYCTNIGKHFL